MRLLVNIYKHRGKGCTNGGVSDYSEDALLIFDETFPQYIANRPAFSKSCVLFIVAGYGTRKQMAIPLDEWLEINDPDRVVNSPRGMFGGNFVYSSDSRFPADAPIHIHDRFE